LPEALAPVGASAPSACAALVGEALAKRLPRPLETSPAAMPAPARFSHSRREMTRLVAAPVAAA
jgi:hypothetical protein